MRCLLLQEQDCFFGIFKEIYSVSESNNIEIINSYISKFAETYDIISESDVSETFEMDLYIKYLSLCKGRRVLELACGSGRITIPLARKGYQVTGVDVSQDMLDIMESKLGRNLRERIQLIKDDVTVLSKVKEKYNLVILPATTIRLLDTDLELFINHIYDYVEDGGYFIFDFRDLLGSMEGIVEGDMVTHSYTKNDEFNVVFVQEQCDCVNMKSKTNYYINTLGKTKQLYLGYTCLNLFHYSDIENVLKRTKFSSYEMMKTGEYTGNVSTGSIYTCILKK